MISGFNTKMTLFAQIFEKKDLRNVQIAQKPEIFGTSPFEDLKLVYFRLTFARIHLRQMQAK